MAAAQDVLALAAEILDALDERMVGVTDAGIIYDHGMGEALVAVAGLLEEAVRDPGTALRCLHRVRDTIAEHPGPRREGEMQDLLRVAIGRLRVGD